MGKIGIIGLGVLIGIFGTTHAQSCETVSTYFQDTDMMSKPADASVMTRAEALTFILRTAEIEAPKLGSSRSYPFLDVPIDTWFAPIAETAAHLGIITWESDQSTFRPADTINRAEFMSLLLNTYEINPTEFTLVKRGIDVPKDTWYSLPMHFASHLEIIPLTDEKALPFNEVSRCDSALIAWRFLEKGGGIKLQAAEQIALGYLEKTLNQPSIENIKNTEKLITSVIAYIEENQKAVSLGYILESARYLTTSKMALENGLTRQAEEMARQAWHAADASGHSLAAIAKEKAHKLAEDARA